MVGNRFTSQICYLFLFQHAHFLLFSHHVKQIFLRFSTEDDASIESEISLEILPEVVLHEYSCITLSHAHKNNKSYYNCFKQYNFSVHRLFKGTNFILVLILIMGLYISYIVVLVTINYYKPLVRMGNGKNISHS